MTATLLESVVKASVCYPPKGIIYGPPGIGKTTFGASADDPLIIDCEHGAGMIECQRTPYLEDWESIDEWLTALEKDNHKYKTVVIDSLDWAVRRIEEHVAGVGNKMDSTLNRSHGGYGNGKQVLKNYVYRAFLPKLDRIIARGIAVILLAHARRAEVTDIDGITVEKTTADLPDDYLNTFVEWSDFVCLARLGNDGKRILVTSETDAALAKNRYGMPGEVDFTWSAFCSAVMGGMKTGKAKK